MKIKYDAKDIEFIPTKIVAVARNYSAHAEEMQSEVPKELQIFLKPQSSLLGNNGTVILPEISKRVEHEVELAVVIGRKCKNVSTADAHKYIMGYSIIVDITARDLQNEAKCRGLPWTISKGFDTFAPFGPVIVPRDRIDPHALKIWLKVNGEYRQRGHTSEMIYSVPYLIEHISKIMTLEPMDIIATGTPQGVGPIEDGDMIEAGIENIGILRFNARRLA